MAGWRPLGYVPMNQDFQRMSEQSLALFFKMEEASSWTPHPEATLQTQVLPPDITWGSLKHLSNQAGTLLQHSGIAYTPDSHLMAMISITNRNLMRVTLVIFLALICPGKAQYSYWAHLLIPPLFAGLTLLAWGIPVSNNDRVHGRSQSQPGLPN